jgi:hypothetical protein
MGGIDIGHVDIEGRADAFRIFLLHGPIAEEHLGVTDFERGMHDLVGAGKQHAAQFLGAERFLVERDGLVAVLDRDLGRKGVKALGDLWHSKLLFTGC